MPKSIQFVIRTLIIERSSELGLSRVDLVRRAGFQNVTKGLRRLDALCAGELNAAASLIAGLPYALELPQEVIVDSVRQTESQLAKAQQITEDEREEAWRAKFQPSAYLLGTEKTPTQIAIFAITGGAARWLRIPLDLSQPPLTFAEQAHRVTCCTPTVPFNGALTGFVVNFTPDFAVRFDLDGNPVEASKRAYCPGQILLTLGGRMIREDTLMKVIGLTPKSSIA